VVGNSARAKATRSAASVDNWPGRLQRLHALEPMQQSVAVGDLDGEAGPGVEFEDHRPLVAVEDEVDADVAQPDSS
jgi:hypothetical protein